MASKGSQHVVGEYFPCEAVIGVIKFSIDLKETFDELGHVLEGTAACSFSNEVGAFRVLVHGAVAGGGLALNVGGDVFEDLVTFLMENAHGDVESRAFLSLTLLIMIAEGFGVAVLLVVRYGSWCDRSL